MPLSSPVTFTAEVTVSSCLAAPETITIYTVGSTESLNLTIATNCACDCGPAEAASPACSGRGALLCGVCSCSPPHSGERCQCGSLAGAVGEAGCRAAGEGAACSGRGECSCGLCTCQPGFCGKYCELDRFSCPKR